MAPLSYAFIGSYFLTRYYARFSDALNLASERVLATAADSDGDDGASLSGQPPYTLVRAKNVGMTAILLYARDPGSIRQIEEAECGFGAADMGNKGAVGLRVTWSGPGQQQQQQQQPSNGNGTENSAELGNNTTELTFVAAHLAAMEWNLKKRNSNWRSIVSGLTFANPRSVLPGVFPASRGAATTPDRSGAGDVAPPSRLPTGDSPDPSEEEGEGEGEAEAEAEEDEQPLLAHDAAALSPSHRAALHDLSVYKPTAHLFVAGDLNYRIAATAPPPLADFPSLDPASDRHFASFLPRDQLTRERRANRTLHGLEESPVTFPPTYKYDVLPGRGRGGGGGGGGERPEEEEEEQEQVEQVNWRFAPHRWPSWCDRVLYLDVPRWARRRAATAEEEEEEGDARIDVRAYDAMPVLATSDHRPVFWRARVPVLGPDVMRPPPLLRDDPRVTLPVPVDVHAWERRAAARRREVVVGWSALLWSTREGAAALATALALGLAAWWLLWAWVWRAAGP